MVLARSLSRSITQSLCPRLAWRWSITLARWWRIPLACLDDVSSPLPFHDPTYTLALQASRLVFDEQGASVTGDFKREKTVQGHARLNIPILLAESGLTAKSLRQAHNAIFEREMFSKELRGDRCAPNVHTRPCSSNNIPILPALASRLSKHMPIRPALTSRPCSQHVACA